MMLLAIFLWVSLLLGQLGALPLGGGVTVYVQDIALTLLILGAIVRYGLFTKHWRFRLIRPIVLFVGFGIVSLIANISQYPPWVIGKGSLYLIRWIAYAAAYGVILVSPFSVQFWLGWLGSFGVALSAIGLIQFVWYPDLRNLWYLGWDPHYYRVFATLLDPNYVGILLVLTLFVLFYLLMGHGRWRVWIVSLMIMTCVALLLTYSRSSYLALLAGLGLAIVYLRRWKEGMFLALLFLLAVVYIPKPGGDTLSLDRYDSTVSRIQNWQQTLRRTGERPVFGYGFNVLPFLPGAGIDSSLLFVGVTTGIVGFVSYLWLVIAQVRLALRLRDTHFKMLVLSSLGAVFVHSLFLHSLFYPWVMIWIWVLVGVTEKYYLE